MRYTFIQQATCTALLVFASGCGSDESNTSADVFDDAEPDARSDVDTPDTEPTDTEPSDTEPTDTEPSDTEPTDTEPTDTTLTDTLTDGDLPDAAGFDCATRVASAGWELCSQSDTDCQFVFEDGTGCDTACAQIGLACTDAFDDVPGACRANTDLPALGCGATGHTSDYCVCTGDVVDPPDAGMDVGTDAQADTADADTDATDVGVDPVPDTSDRPPHEALLGELIGFGQDTTGGAGGAVVAVTSLADSGPGTLRELATGEGPLWIRFDVDGLIALSSNIEISSDITIDGRGADITVSGYGLFVQNGEGNVIINNIRVRDSVDDLIRFYNGGANMWVHHCTLENGGDGAFDATEGVTGITVSYTHILNHDKAMLIGAGSDDGDGASMRWTAHHNYYQDVVQRLPFIRFGWAHSFNNLYAWRSGTAMSVRLPGAQMLVENSIFQPNPPVGHKLIGASEDRGDVRVTDCLERPTAPDLVEYVETNPDLVFDASDYYAYSHALETATDALGDRLRAQAGWQDVPFPE